jgi:hypothetical protein
MQRNGSRGNVNVASRQAPFVFFHYPFFFLIVDTIRFPGFTPGLKKYFLNGKVRSLD